MPDNSKGWWRPRGYREILGKEGIQNLLSRAYGPRALRVSSIGLVGKKAMAFLDVDPAYPWLEDHFRRKIVVRLVELAEIGAQAALVLALVEKRIEMPTLIGFKRAWVSFRESNPLRMPSVMPGDVVVVRLDLGQRTYCPYSQKSLQRYIRIEGQCPFGINSIRPVGDSGGAAWVLGRRGVNFPQMEESPLLKTV